MSTLVTDPSALRRRAQSLRATASALEHGGLRGALAAAGPDTWTGPPASALHADLARSAAAVARAAAELRRLAHRLETDAALALPS
jgi:hypothetical protein